MSPKAGKWTDSSDATARARSHRQLCRHGPGWQSPAMERLERDFQSPSTRTQSLPASLVQIRGPQPLAGKQVPGVPVRSRGLNSRSIGDVFARSFKSFGDHEPRDRWQRSNTRLVQAPVHVGRVWTSSNGTRRACVDGATLALWPPGTTLTREVRVGIIVGERSRHGVDAAATGGPTAHAASPRIRALRA